MTEICKHRWIGSDVVGVTNCLFCAEINDLRGKKFEPMGKTNHIKPQKGCGKCETQENCIHKEVKAKGFILKKRCTKLCWHCDKKPQNHSQQDNRQFGEASLKNEQMLKTSGTFNLSEKRNKLLIEWLKPRTDAMEREMFKQVFYEIEQQDKEFIKRSKDKSFCENCEFKYNDDLGKTAIACCPETSWIIRLGDMTKLAGEEIG